MSQMHFDAPVLWTWQVATFQWVVRYRNVANLPLAKTSFK